MKCHRSARMAHEASTCQEKKPANPFNELDRSASLLAMYINRTQLASPTQQYFSDSRPIGYPIEVTRERISALNQSVPMLPNKMDDFCHCKLDYKVRVTPSYWPSPSSIQYYKMHPAPFLFGLLYSLAIRSFNEDVWNTFKVQIDNILPLLRQHHHNRLYACTVQYLIINQIERKTTSLLFSNLGL